MTESNLLEISEELLRQLFPICRSITGDGVRKSLEILRKYAPELRVLEYPSGKQVFDWTIPKEWNIRDAYIKDSNGNRIIDFQKSNIHVMGYSIPIHKIIKWDELEPHLYTLPKLPEAIPYRTSYYKENWGFCLAYNQFLELDKKTEYEVCIDTTLEDGSLTLAEAILEGETQEEILISTYCCHPSLANDNLSGMVLTTLLFKELRKLKRKYTYRFVILPETIGAIVYLAHNEKVMRKIKGGFVITTVGGPGKFGYKKTFLENHEIDRVVRLTFKELGVEYIEYPFIPDGSDERQYSSPGFRIPVSTICKDKYYEYDYYHTSLDNLKFVKSENILKTLNLYLLAIEKLEINQTYKNLFPNGEVQLGKRGLYPQTGGAINQLMESETVVKLPSKINLKFKNELDVILWILFWSDGKNSLLDIAEKTKIPFEQISGIAKSLKEKGLLETC